MHRAAPRGYHRDDAYPRGPTLSRTLLFVHGTGTRAERYSEALKLIKAQVADHKIPADVRGFYWGDKVGARLTAWDDIVEVGVLLTN